MPAPDPLISFFEDRIKFYFRDHRGFAYDEVNAAMAVGWSNLPDLEARLIRIQNLRSSPDFEPLAASFKRIRNILEIAGSVWSLVFVWLLLASRAAAAIEAWSGRIFRRRWLQGLLFFAVFLVLITLAALPFIETISTLVSELKFVPLIITGYPMPLMDG